MDASAFYTRTCSNAGGALLFSSRTPDGLRIGQHWADSCTNSSRLSSTLTAGPVMAASGTAQSLHIATSLLPVKRAVGSITSNSTVWSGSKARLSCWGISVERLPSWTVTSRPLTVHLHTHKAWVLVRHYRNAGLHACALHASCMQKHNQCQQTTMMFIQRFKQR